MSVKSIAKKAFKANAITEEEYKQLLSVIKFYYESLKPQGEWIFCDDGKGLMAACSECKAITLSTHGNFCPNCGADMIGGRE